MTMVKNLVPLVLAGLWPFANFLYANIGEEYVVSELGLYAALYSVALIAVFGIARLIFKRVSSPYLAVLIATLSVLFTSFGVIYDLFGTLGFEDVKSRYIGYLIVSCVIFLLAMRVFRNESARKIFVVIIAIMFAMPLAQFAWANSPRDIDESDIVKDAENKVVDGTVVDARSIYFFIPDGYPRADMLEDITGYDNSPFLDAAEERGFVVIDQAHSNYAGTNVSIPSTLSMDYIHGDGDIAHIRRAAEGVSSFKIKRGQNPLFERLKGYGYKQYFAYGNENVGSDCPEGVDYCYLGEGLINTLQAALLDMTPVLNILQVYFTDYVFNLTMRLDLAMDNFPWHEEAPIFAYFHFLQPHPPYIWRPDCSMRENLPNAKWRHIEHVFWSIGLDEELRHEYFVENIKCTNKRILEAIDEILEHDPDAIIVVQGDHGTAHRSEFKKFEVPASEWTEAEKEERMSNLNMIRLPERCRKYLYPTMMNMNTFRIVLACIEHRTPELVADRAYFHTYHPEDRWNAYLFMDTTDLQPDYSELD